MSLSNLGWLKLLPLLIQKPHEQHPKSPPRQVCATSAGPVLSCLVHNAAVRASQSIQINAPLERHYRIPYSMQARKYRTEIQAESQSVTGQEQVRRTKPVHGFRGVESVAMVVDPSQQCTFSIFLDLSRLAVFLDFHIPQFFQFSSEINQ